MKKSLFTIVTIVGLTFAVSGCNPNKSVKREMSEQQKIFYHKIIDINSMERRGFANQIQKDDFEKKSNRDLFNYMDSVKLFTNWIGTISNIEKEESGETIALNFKLNLFEDNVYNKIIFNVTHLVDKKNLDRDHIYQSVKGIPEHSRVYFDGFMRTTNTNEFYKDFSDHDNSYKFWIIDVSTKEIKDKTYDDFKKGLELTFEICNTMKKSYLKQISDKEKNKKMESLMPELKRLKEKMPIEDKLYIERVANALVHNFLFGDKNS